MARMHAPSWIGPGLLFLFVVPLFAYGAYSIGDRWYQNYILTRQEESIRAEVMQLREENLRLQRELNFARSDSGIEKVAREQLGLIKPGDTAIQLVGPQGAQAAPGTGEASPGCPGSGPPPSDRAGCGSLMDSSGADVVARVQAAVRASLDRFRLTDSSRPLVVAVSGGADSLCLLDALVAVVPEAGECLKVGHVDHQLRPASAADGEYVRTVAQRLGVPAVVDTVNVPALARAERLGVEEAARLARYRSLARIADDLGTDIVLTGHTRDDSVETVMLNFLRGTGARGLGGIGENK